jgi:hypothetical protein
MDTTRPRKKYRLSPFHLVIIYLLVLIPLTINYLHSQERGQIDGLTGAILIFSKVITIVFLFIADLFVQFINNQKKYYWILIIEMPFVILMLLDYLHSGYSFLWEY